jgi:hypothetical protein
MPEFDARERILILTALWNYELQAGQVWAWPDLEACALRDRASYRKDELMNQDPGMPLNALVGGDAD